MTEAELAIIEQMHSREWFEGEDAAWGCAWCQGHKGVTGARWPCDTVRLVAEVRRLQRLLDMWEGG